jgi:hypothetical protein
MSEVLASLKKKGGGSLSETILWTNVSPTSAMGNGTLLTLSQDYTDFDYIMIIYRLSTTNPEEYSVIYPKDSVTWADTAASSRMGIQGFVTYQYARAISRLTSTNLNQLNVTNARQLQGTLTSTTVLIPIQIIGIK